MSLRVSQPLWSTSFHAVPNSLRSYPVLGARPFTGKVLSSWRTASASPVATASPAALVWVMDGVGVLVATEDDADVEGEPVVAGGSQPTSTLAATNAASASQPAVPPCR